MKTILRNISIALFAVAALCFAASGVIADEAVAAPLRYAAAAAGLIAILCNFIIRPKDEEEEAKKQRKKKKEK